MQANIQNSEYYITWRDHSYLPDIEAAYQAPNRAHNLRTYFTSGGVRIIPRTAEAPDWIWGLSLVGYGFQDDVNPVMPAEVSASQNYVEYGRENITEWYINDEHGLEQGFTLNAPPVSQNALATPQVVLTMDIYGNLKAIRGNPGGDIDFHTDDGTRVLRYGKLYVSDSTGKDLPAELVISCRQIDILIDTSGAIYPITVDPLATSPNWTAEGNRTDEWFGWSVASAGDVNGDSYSDIIIGVPGYDNGQSQEGGAFVYHGSASGLSATPNWTAEGNQASAAFGYCVASDGDVNGDGYSDVIVGAPFYDNPEVDEGMAYVYHGSASGLSNTAESDPAKPNPKPNWTVAPCNQATAWFGASVASAGDVNDDGYSDVIIGAYLYDNPETDEGMAFVYHGSASGLSSSANWTAESNQANAWFGNVVASAGNVNDDSYSDVIVAAIHYTNGQSQEGGAFVYHGSASGLSNTPNWTAEGNQVGACLGGQVATAGDVNGDGCSDVIVGAPGYDNGQTDEGGAFVYHGSASGLSSSANWTAESNQVDAIFGISVASAGDVNSDGYSDVIVGAYDYDNGQVNEGAAFVYRGSASGLSATPNWTAAGNQAGGRFGNSVASAGDVNGDGYADVVVGAYLYDNGQTDEGMAFVYYGLAPGITVNPTSGLTTTEAGGTATFTVVLNTQPSDNVTIGLSSSDLTEGTVLPSSLTFTPANWDTAWSVTVTGVDDTIVDGNVAYTIITALATSTDPSYNNLNTSDVNVTNNDNDFAIGSVTTATGTGRVSFTTSSGNITSLTAVAEGTLPTAGKPAGVTFPHGLFSCNVTGMTPGSTVTLTITLPSAMPAGTQYWKCQNGVWVDCTSLLGSNDGDNILTLTLTDGGLGDADGVADGTIVDPGGPGYASAPSRSAEGASTGGSSATTLRSPQMKVTYPKVNPSQAKINQPITITANVVNEGGMTGSTRVALKINGKVEETKLVTVGPGGSIPVKFTVTKQEPGAYTVILGNQRASFVVAEGANEAQSVNGGLIAILVLGLLVIATILLVALSSRRTTY